MNRSRTWAIAAVVIAVLILLYIFVASGGPEEVQSLEAPGAGETGDAATSTEPAGEGQ